ncbi:SAM-dependent methyltransferase [Virgisporangium ochraceum]|nr:SAM-dependent methyltransferase [Virgisporangium ochraceum]
MQVDPSSGLDTSVVHPARRYNYWLDGKDNFAVDRDSGDEIAKIYPSVRTAALHNRAFLRRAVTYLAGQRGVRQFLDIGTGLPTADNTHEVAQQIAPECRVVYVDNDPMVMTHARALLTSTPQGQTAYIEQDLRDPDGIVGDAAMSVLDFDEPVALMLVAVAHFVLDDEVLAWAVAALRDAMPVGSYLVLSHATADPVDPVVRAAWDQAVASGRHGDFKYRSKEQILPLLGDWRPVPPGLVPVADWRRPAVDPVPFTDAAAYGAVAVKPRPRAR